MYGREQYQQAATTTAGPAQLVLMLYDGALTHLGRARTALEAEPRDLMGAHESIMKVQAIISELDVSLDHEAGGQIASSLASLYLYCREQLVEANLNKDPEPLAIVADVIAPLRDAWEESCVQGDVRIAG